jgi:protein-S-isoprenylcysteine O-methyltransferase Ste14
MPRSGAIFSIIAIALLQIRLILAEEAFLGGKLGGAYVAYCKMVPRLVPALRSRFPAGGRSPHWGQAFLGESYMWGVTLSFAFFGWRYNAKLLLQAVVVSFGISLVLSALVPKNIAK